MLPNYYMATLHISDIRRALLEYPCLEEETSMQMVSWLIGVKSWNTFSQFVGFDFIMIHKFLLSRKDRWQRTATSS